MNVALQHWIPVLTALHAVDFSGVLFSLCLLHCALRFAKCFTDVRRMGRGVFEAWIEDALHLVQVLTSSILKMKLAIAAMMYHTNHHPPYMMYVA